MAAIKTTHLAALVLIACRLPHKRVPFYTNVGITCFYQLVGGEYYFAIGFPRESGFPDTIALGTDSLQIEDGQSYQLGEPLPGNAFAEVLFRWDQTIFRFIENTTNDLQSGTLTVTKLDEANQIVSGTFEFTILNPENNQIYHFTEGRFDAFFRR